MLTAAQFHHWCTSLHLSQETCQVLLELRASAPVRRVGSRAGNVSGAYASRKMGCTIQFESYKVVLWAIYTMEHDASVLEYYDQPGPLELHYLSRAGRNQTVSHTPDFLVLRQDGVWLEEWKPEDKLLELTLTQPHRYQRDERGKFHCPPGEEAARRLGLGYRVRSSAELPPRTIRNLMFLEDYFVAPPVPEAVQARVMGLVEAHPGISLAAVHEQAGEASLDVLFAMIAQGHLYVDLDAMPLIEHQAVRLYLNRATAEAHALLLASSARASDHETASLSRHLALSETQRVLWDGRIWTLVNLGESRVTLRSEEDMLTDVPLQDFLGRLDAGHITIPRAVSAPALPHMHPEALTLWRKASERDLEIANRRHQFVLAYRDERRSTVNGMTVPVRTLRSWVSRYTEAEAKYGVGYVGLLPRTARSGNRTPRAPRDTHELLDSFITDSFETPTHPHARAVYPLT